MLMGILSLELRDLLLDAHATLMPTFWYFCVHIMQSCRVFHVSITSFQVLSADATQEVGKITKQWGGLAKEYFTDADNFGIQCESVIYYSITRGCNFLNLVGYHVTVHAQNSFLKSLLF